MVQTAAGGGGRGGGGGAESGCFYPVGVDGMTPVGDEQRQMNWDFCNFKLLLLPKFN